MKPTRKTQPYRKGPREPGVTLDAILQGRGVTPNPMDQRRDLQRMLKRRKKKHG